MNLDNKVNIMAETLREKQSRFVRMVSDLINFAHKSGYELTFGEAWRPSAQAALNAKNGVGIKNSLHIIRLAVDFNLFKDGVWLTDGMAHEPLGVYWESIGGTWGGRFKDGNHYSLEHNGVK